MVRWRERADALNDGWIALNDTHKKRGANLSVRLPTIEVVLVGVILEKACQPFQDLSHGFPNQEPEDDLPRLLHGSSPRRGICAAAR